MKKLAILIIAATVLSGCSAYQYYSVNTRVDLSKYRSFAWLRGDGSQAERYYDNDIATEKIIDAVNLELTDRGLQLDKDKPDLLIKYTAVVNDETRSYNDPVYYQGAPHYIPRMGYFRGRRVYYYQYIRPFPVYVGSELRKVQVKQGNIMIDIIDRKTSKVIWRGWGEGPVDNPAKAINDLPKVVDKIFRKLS